MLNKSWTITADVDVPDDKASGMIVTHGGLEGGYGLYLRDGKPTFVYNYLVRRPPHLRESRTRCPKARRSSSSTSSTTAAAWARAVRSRITANGKKVAEGRLERTIPMQFSLGEGLDIGMDGGSPVDFTYKLPFAFTGTIEKVTIELKAKASDLKQPEAAVRGKAVGVAHP